MSGGEAAYNKIDDKGEVYQSVSMAWPNKKKAPDDYFVPLIHPVTKKACPIPERGWRNPSATMNALLEKGEILFGVDETTQPRRKYLLRENMMENVPSVIQFGGSDDELLKKLKIPFDNPKPINFEREVLSYCLNDNEIVLDFFAGSASIAHAVLDLNINESSGRKFIMVQLPELCDAKTEANRTGFNNIADIGKERIRRVIKSIEKEKGETLSKAKQLDLGFKVFKLDKSNFKIWDAEKVSADKQALEKQLELHIEHIDPKATQEDILFEILLKAGFELTTKIEKIELEGKAVYSIEDGAMLICLEKELTKEVIKAMAEKQPSRVICLDQGFVNNDQLKTNTVQIMKSKDVDDFRTV